MLIFANISLFLFYIRILHVILHLLSQHGENKEMGFKYPTVTNIPSVSLSDSFLFFKLSINVIVDSLYVCTNSSSQKSPFSNHVIGGRFWISLC